MPAKKTHIVIALALLALLIPASAASAKVPKGFFGITAFGPTAKDFRGMGKAGFGSFRFEVNWGAIQKTREGAINWAYPDAFTKAAAENGMSATIVLYGTPRFVHKSKDGALYPPTNSKENLREWEQFAHAAARRYGPGGDFWAANPSLEEKPVRRWLIWNEQNSRNFWRPKPDPRDYAKLVKVSDRAISAADPGAEITLGGMYCCPRDSRSLSAASFLKRLYKVKGVERRFDVLSVHPYGSGVKAVKRQIADMRNVARRAGDRRIELLVGELGWASSGPSRSESVVSAKGQANRLKQSLKLLAKKRNAWNVLGAYVYLWRDFDASLTACQWCPRAGLVKQNGKAKPALDAVRKTIKRLR